jgi:uroporphyrinogen decarboxylase
VQQAVTNGEVQSQVISLLAKKYPFAASSMIMDLSVEAEAFGAKIEFHEHEVPTILNRLVSDARSIDRLVVPSLAKGRIPQNLKAAQQAIRSISDKPVFAGCIGPFSLAGRLYGLSELMVEILLQPDLVHGLVEKCSEFLLSYIAGYKSLGADGIFMAEPAAGMLSPEACQNFSSNYIQRIVERLQDDHFLFILHNCGNTNLLVESMQSTGAGVLHFGNSCDIVSALKRIFPDRLVMGNLDPVGVFRMGSAVEVYERTKTLLLATQIYKNFIISSGCDIPPGVPKSNIVAFLEAVTEFNNR